MTTRHIIYGVMAMFAVASLLTGCGAEKNLRKAEKYLAIGEYYDAATQFKTA